MPIGIGQFNQYVGIRTGVSLKIFGGRMNEVHINHENHPQKTGFNWYQLGLWDPMGL